MSTQVVIHTDKTNEADTCACKKLSIWRKHSLFEIKQNNISNLGPTDKYGEFYKQQAHFSTADNYNMC